MTDEQPREEPDLCDCGRPVWTKGKSGYYDVCDECHDSDTAGGETVGDALGAGVTKSELTDTERTLQRFHSVAVDEMDETPEWLQTAHAAVSMAREHYDRELQFGETDDELTQTND